MWFLHFNNTFSYGYWLYFQVICRTIIWHKVVKRWHSSLLYLQSSSNDGELHRRGENPPSFFTSLWASYNFDELYWHKNMTWEKKCPLAGFTKTFLICWVNQKVEMRSSNDFQCKSNAMVTKSELRNKHGDWAWEILILNIDINLILFNSDKSGSVRGLPVNFAGFTVPNGTWKTSGPCKLSSWHKSLKNYFGFN